MPRRTLTALAAGLVAVLALYAVPPAQAAYGDPGPTSTGFYFNGGDHAGETVTIVASTSAKDGAPGSKPTGSMTFTVGAQTFGPVPVVDRLATLDYVLLSNNPIEVTVDFHGTGGWEDSSSTKTFTPLYKVEWASAGPTVATTGNGLKLTLKFAVYTRNTLGQGLPGRKITFTLFAPGPNVASPSPNALQVCSTVTDANGLATCNAVVNLASLVTILTGGAYANQYGAVSGPSGAYSGHFKIPAFSVS